MQWSGASIGLTDRGISMQRNGYSFLELLVVLSIVSSLLAVASLNFHDLLKKSGIESQTKMLYADLMKLRAHALFEKQTRAVRFTPHRFAIYPSDQVTGTPVLERELRYPLRNASLTLRFNERGLAESNASICVDEDGSAAYDSLVVFTTRIQMGKRETGRGCTGDYIKTR